jgi:hypothetical protein
MLRNLAGAALPPMEGGTCNCKLSYASARQTRCTHQDYFTPKACQLVDLGDGYEPRG